MALYKLHDFDPSYRDHFNGDDIKGLDVYSQPGDDKIGTVHDALVDEGGEFRYLIIDTGFWVFGKKVMLPIGLARIDYNDRRVYARLTKEQAHDLPEFGEDLKVDRDYEDRVRGVYNPSASSASVVDNTAPLNTSYAATSATSTAEASAPLDPVSTSYASASTAGTNINDVDYDADYATYQRDPYYDQNPDLYGVNDRDHQSLRLYQERLLANKRRMKTGDVAVGKRVETETKQVSVPVEKERVVIERTNPTDIGTAVTPGSVDFHDGEVARVEVYEEVADIRKEAFVREEVQVRKEVDREVVDAEETLRREELDINTQGNPIIDRRPQ